MLHLRAAAAACMTVRIPLVPTYIRPVGCMNRKHMARIGTVDRYGQQNAFVMLVGCAK